MKEASGELSMTAITVVAIAALAGVFTTLIYPQIKKNIEIQSKCSSKFNCGQCSGGMASCTVLREDGTAQTDFQCPCTQ